MLDKYLKAHAWMILEAGLTNQYGEWPYRVSPPTEHDQFSPSLVFVNDSGVWPNTTESGMGWKPCWELINEPDAPDCSQTPGLPFPFSPNELAAWMLKGSGAFVATCFGSWEDGPDFSTMNHPDANKAREAVRAAYEVCRSAISDVGPEPEPIGDEAHKIYETARRAALKKFGLLDSTKSELEEADRASRQIKVNKEIEHEKQALLQARATDTQRSDAWVSSMVRYLLLDPHEVQSAQLLSKAQFLDGFSSVACGATLGAEAWAKLPMVPWNKAAMLVSGINPNLCTDPEKDAPHGTDLVAWRTTLNVFESVVSDNRKRTLREWAEVALVHGREIDPRVKVAVEAVAKSDDGGLGSNAKVNGAPTVRVPASHAQEEAVIAKLRELGFDPVSLPPYQPGKPSEVKQEVKSALRYSDGVMKKVWIRLKKDGRIRYRV